MENYILVVVVGLSLGLIVLGFITKLLTSKVHNRLLRLINTSIWLLIIIGLYASVLLFYFWVFVFSVFGSYIILTKLITSLIGIESVSRYLSLTLSLVSLAYVPEKVGYWYLKIFLRKRSSSKFFKYYPSVIKFLRFDLWIYLLSFLLVMISSIETFANKSLITLNVWIQFKPVILQSVVTVITLDRFIKPMRQEWPSIVNDLRKTQIFIEDKVWEVTDEE